MGICPRDLLAKRQLRRPAMQEYDAILIPGGGVREGGTIPSWVQRRFDRAVRIHQGAYIVALSAGTTHRPPPADKHGFPIFESIAGARYLMEAGIPPEQILTETQSYDTIGNAFFSRVVHVDPRGLRRLLIITSDFHLPRTEAVFRWVYGLEPQSLSYELHFEGVSDPSMDPEVLRDREGRERESLKETVDLARQMTQMPEFHQWLFTKHKAYKAGGREFSSSHVQGATLESY
jgi:uncharacterized SAM-binding protein YcdF (DUF218 family)